MKEFWNDRYGNDAYAYGTDPNDFLKTLIIKGNKKILCIAEGEGRNAVYLASIGHEVTCVDYSEKGLEKAQKLASQSGVNLNLVCADLNEFDFGLEKWDVIVSIFGHFPSAFRQSVHRNFFAALKKNGQVILEAYTKEQLKYNTGGPQSEEMLYSEDLLKSDFEDFGQLEIIAKERMIHEGQFHNGLSSVVQVHAIKV
jgi:2-polyprenyl-3-methyl-5-hydroxy-6-metoxy-1,4-benzoquinol methylase